MRTRLRWTRGRDDQPGSGRRPGDDRALEWLGWDDAGRAIARVVRLQGPYLAGRRLTRATPLDDEARVIAMRPPVPADGRWLVVVRERVVGRATLPLQAVRRAEAVLNP